MPDVTADFLARPVPFLHETPCQMTAKFTGIQLKYVRFIKDEEMNLVQMRETNAGNGVPFYVLGWLEEQSSIGQLGSAANYFFTGPLTGCTFAVDKNWRTPRVVHVNQTLHGGAMDIVGMNQSVNQAMQGTGSWLRLTSEPNITVVQSHAREEDYRYNIFGYRSRVGWSFFQQVVELRWNGMAVHELQYLDTWF